MGFDLFDNANDDADENDCNDNISIEDYNAAVLIAAQQQKNITNGRMSSPFVQSPLPPPPQIPTSLPIPTSPPLPAPQEKMLTLEEIMEINNGVNGRRLNGNNPSGYILR